MDATDYELVDLFDWQEEARGMISQMEFVRRMDMQAETIERYVQEGNRKDLFLEMVRRMDKA